MSAYSLPRPIAVDDDTSAFDSGEPSLDEYLRRRALANHVQGASRCFLTCRDDRVVGHYALASASVQHSDVAGKVRRNMPDPVPVILLSRLAVDRKEQGTGLGKNLLRDAILRSVQASGSSASERFWCTRSMATTAPSTPTSTLSRRRPTHYTWCC